MDRVFKAADFIVFDDHMVYCNSGLSVRKINFKFRHFNGGWSSIINRHLVAPLDAVGVLLYDPSKDKVILIEQFRLAH